MIKGSCLCKKIQFEIKNAPKQINLCHCKMCQKFSGSAFGSFMRVLARDFKIISGLEFEKVFDSSEWAARAFCSNCGASIRYINKEQPELTFVAAGCLDDDPKICPRHHIFVKDKAPWYEINSNIPQFQDWKSSISNNLP
jgi:hypothetical protein